MTFFENFVCFVEIPSSVAIYPINLHIYRFIPWPVCTSINGQRWTMTQRSSDIFMIIIFSLSLWNHSGWMMMHPFSFGNYYRFFFGPFILFDCHPSIFDVDLFWSVRHNNDSVLFMIWFDQRHTQHVFFFVPCRFHTWTVVLGCNDFLLYDEPFVMLDSWLMTAVVNPN